MNRIVASRAVVAVVLAAAIVGGFSLFAVSAAPAGDVVARPMALPPRTGVSPVNFTFVGNAARGWGFSNATITEPGPNITLYFGDTVKLTMIATDSSPHNWFVDYDNSLAPNGGEPSSPDFNVPGNVVGTWNFTAIQPGTWTYRCRVHPTSMTGTIRILPQPRPVNLTFYGDAAFGWGFSNATIREPGPPLVVLWGTNVTLRLIAHDSAPHTWFIDYNNDLVQSPGEPGSPVFNNPVGKSIVWPFKADRTGNWTYRCAVHPTTMTGNVSIVGGPPPELPRGTIPLITGIMVGTLAFVLIFAAVYHVRAVRAAKRMR